MGTEKITAANSTGILPQSDSSKKSWTLGWVDMVNSVEDSIFMKAASKPNEDGNGSGGDISTGEKIGQILSGAGLTFTSMLKNWQSSLGWAIGTSLLLTFCPTLSVPMVVGGTLFGGISTIAAIARASASRTKNATRKAYQDIGAGLLAFIPSFLGCKAALKTANDYGVVSNKLGASKDTGYWSSFVECCKLSIGLKPKGAEQTKNIYSTAFSTASDKFKSFFIFKSKTGNDKAQKLFDEVLEANEKKLKELDNDDKLNLGKKQKLAKDIIDAQSDTAQKQFDCDLNKNKKNMLEQERQKALEELGKVKNSKFEYDNYISEQVAEYNKQKTAILKELDNIDKLEQCWGRATSDTAAKMQVTLTDRRNLCYSTLSDLDNSISNLQTKTYAQYQREIAQFRRRTGDGFGSINHELLELSKETPKLEAEVESAKEKLAKLIESRDKLPTEIKELQDKVKAFKDKLKKPEDYQKLMESIGSSKATMINANNNKNVLDDIEKALTTKDEHVFIFSDKPDDTRTEFLTKLSGRTTAASPILHEMRCHYVPYDPEKIIAAIKTTKPSASLFSDGIQEGLLRTMIGYSIFDENSRKIFNKRPKKTNE